MSLPVHVIVTFEQHSPGLQVGTVTSSHRYPSPHPPLSMAHEYTQYASPVASHTLHSDPLRHGCHKQAMYKNSNSNYVLFHRYLMLG